MQYIETPKQTPPSAEAIRLERGYHSGFRVIAVLLISMGVLLATFAIGGVWMSREGGSSFWEGILGGEETSATQPEEPSSLPDPEVPEEPAPIPEGATPIRSEDLACLSLGEGYLHNPTVLTPDVVSLSRLDVSEAIGSEPLVLILHTHTSEAYAEEGATYLPAPLGNETYSRDAARNVLAAGEELSRVLNRNGIPTLHCVTEHDAGGIGGSYAAAAESIRFYLSHYPSIRYVVDLHRDAILDGEGNYLRAVTEENKTTTAQVMAVVGTPGGGEACPNWEKNLALALQLRSLLNAEGDGVCRPVALRNSTYNQELAAHSILLEIGTGANSVEEARRAAALVGEALTVIIRG